jgi:glucosyl-3-phosphoglycerate phosphatase
VAPGSLRARATDGANIWPDRAGSHLIKLVLWRHAQTAWNAQRRFQGQTDVPLDAIGREQAERSARLVAALKPTVIFSSDLARASGTAEILARLTGLSVQLDKDLRERYGGVWEGLTDTEIRERYPEAHATWNPPNGEPFDVVAGRTAAALERIVSGLDAGSVAVVVGHGAAINLGISRLLGLPEQDRVIGPLANCAWSVLVRRAGRWRLLEHNVGRLPEPVGDPAIASTSRAEEESAADALAEPAVEELEPAAESAPGGA